MSVALHVRRLLPEYESLETALKRKKRARVPNVSMALSPHPIVFRCPKQNRGDTLMPPKPGMINSPLSKLNATDTTLYTRAC